MVISREKFQKWSSSSKIDENIETIIMSFDNRSQTSSFRQKITTFSNFVVNNNNFLKLNNISDYIHQKTIDHVSNLMTSHFVDHRQQLTAKQKISSENNIT